MIWVFILVPLFVAFLIWQGVGIGSRTGNILPWQSVRLGKYGFWIILAILYIVTFSAALVEHKLWDTVQLGLLRSLGLWLSHIPEGTLKTLMPMIAVGWPLAGQWAKKRGYFPLGDKNEAAGAAVAAAVAGE
jgi:hypothetical protein